MKKFGKIIVCILSIAAVAAGAYYLYKKLFAKNKDESLDDLCDSVDDFGDEEAAESREYVSINITSEDDEEEKPEE